MEIRIYFEGGPTLRGGFEAFFSDLRRAAREAQSELYLVPAKDGISAYRKAARAHPAAWNILLKDSEEPMPPDVANLLQRHGIHPTSAGVFWMVQLALPHPIGIQHSPGETRSSLITPARRHSIRNLLQKRFHLVNLAALNLEHLG